LAKGVGRVGAAAVLVAGVTVLTPSPGAAQTATAGGSGSATRAVTFAKDVAPIFQKKCQSCHRAGSMAPMSLVTYEETRPWVKSIRQRVVNREMPPWHLDRTVGVQKFKNDRSLSDGDIATIVGWVDSGARLGNPADLPPPVQWPDDEEWMIGTPDLLVAIPEQTIPASGPDTWLNIEVDTGLTEERYVRAVETRPSKTGRRVVHHAVTSLADGGGSYVSEYAVGKNGEVYPEGTGRRFEKGQRLRFNLHYHPYGEKTTDRTAVAFKLYPTGYVPKHEVVEVNVGVQNGHLYNELDIPPHTVTRHDAYYRLPRAARLITFQPHMHIRGKAMTLEAIYPNHEISTINSVDRFDFNWHNAYVYADDAAPLLPAGTILHTIGIHDNTAAHRGNPDPNQWVGTGNRSFDDMLQCHILLVYMSDEEYEQAVAERRRAQRSSQP
jgi:hypothetical protein